MKVTYVSEKDVWILRPETDEDNQLLELFYERCDGTQLQRDVVHNGLVLYVENDKKVIV